MFSIPILVLMFAVMQSIDGMAIDEGTGWMTRNKPLTRYTRDALEMNATLVNATTFEDAIQACTDARVCHYGDMCHDFYRVMHTFNFGTFHSKLDEWCKPHKECWDETCDETHLKMEIENDEKFIQWACDHKAGFEETSCFQDPFPERMTGCRTKSFTALGGGVDVGILQRANGFRRCVITTLDELPGCEGDKKTTFKSFFTFVLNEQIKMIRLHSP